MSEQNPNNYEMTDAGFRPIVWGGIVLVAIMIIAFVSMYVLLGNYEARQAATATPLSPLAEERPLPPEPRLQVLPEIDLQTFRANEDSLVNSYGWVSKEAGVVRIPVDRAMELMLQRGFPARQSENGN
jgi:hypothetical protein